MNKSKRINEIITVELSGISEVIREYSTDHFIVSYAEKLTDKKIINQKHLLKYLVNELDDWYRETIDEILNGEYIVHKDLHSKSYKIIKELNSLL